MASISSLGIGSGLDIQSLVAGLIEAEGAAKSARLTRKEALYEAKLSALSAVKSALSDFQGTFSQLKLTSTFNTYTASSSSSSTFTATASNGASEASYDIEVNQIAQSQKITSSAIADKTTSIGTGTLVVKFGTYTYDGMGVETGFSEDTGNSNSGTEIDITDGSMEGIRDAINHANIGVIARKPQWVPFLRAALSSDFVATWFEHLEVEKVERWDLPGLHAMNFMLYNVLGGGGFSSLRVDPQGKAFAQILLEAPIPIPRTPETESLFLQED